MTVFNRAFRFALAVLPRVFLPVAVLAVILAGTATASPATGGPPPTVDMVWSNLPTSDTYRVGPYTCVRTYLPAADPCVFDPDPSGAPVPVEPDNDPTPRRFLPDGTDVRAVMVPAAWSTTPPPDQPTPEAVTRDADDQPEPREDDPSSAFDCRLHGNGVCGPGNDNGHAAGCYVRKGDRAGTLIRPWDAAMAADPHYRPDGCGTRTAKDRAVDDAWSGGRDGTLCAATATGTGVVCWFVAEPRPGIADGPAWVPPAP